MEESKSARESKTPPGADPIQNQKQLVIRLTRRLGYGSCSETPFSPLSCELLEHVAE